MILIKQICLLFVCVLLLNGCAMFKVGDLPLATPVSAREITTKPTLSYTLQAEFDLFGTQNVPASAMQKLREEADQVLRGSGCFAPRFTFNNAADIKINMLLRDSGNPAAMIPAVITGLSLYTIPSWATDHFELKATVNTRDKCKTYVVKDDVRLVQWLPMAFAFPFHNFSTVTDVRKNMYATLLYQMYRDGLLKSATTTQTAESDQ